MTHRATPFVLLALCLAAFFIMLAPTQLTAQSANYEQLRAQGEKLCAEKSFSLAHEEYAKAQAMKLAPEEARWVEFRLADTQWRAQAATNNADTTKLDAAAQQLEKLVRDVKREEEHDRLWAEVEESLGDYYWTRQNSPNWGQAWPYYQNALEWWAGRSDLEVARARYLHIVWTATRPGWAPWESYYYGWYGNILPLPVLENARTIAISPVDKAHANYLLALRLARSNDERQLLRVPAIFEEALKAGKSVDWYDNALYSYAEWLSNSGRSVMAQQADGRITWTRTPDYVKAVALYRRLLEEFKPGESQYCQQAKSQLAAITTPVAQVSVSNIFVPGSEQQYALHWRNVKHVELALYKVDLTKSIHFSKENNLYQWVQSIDVTGAEKTRSWSKETEDKGDYQPGDLELRLDTPLPVGAYVLTASAGGANSRDLLLVTDTTMVLKTTGKQAMVYICNALDGSPVAKGHVRLWEAYYNGSDNAWHYTDAEKEANEDGICVFDLDAINKYNVQIFAAATCDNRQAFALSNNGWYGHAEQPQWRIYTTTDRPAYRPGETLHWKVLARQYDGAVYTTPAQQRVEYEVIDPRGSKVKADTVTLNTFGSAWGELALTSAMPLGEYRVNYWDAGRQHHIGWATFFRLEEYKLPEFKVRVQTPEENGKKKTYRPGDTVTANIQADYYFGGPVANAAVEAVVYQSVYYRRWAPWREFPWYFRDIDGRENNYYGGGQIIKRETLKTDATGKAALSFETPSGTPQDLQFRIEARVTDSSRREIVSEATVRVTRQSYYVYPRPRHYCARPQDKVTVDFTAQDANEQPAQVEGTVTVTREIWKEVWISPEGRTVSTPPGSADILNANRLLWRLRSQGYEHEAVLTRTVKTDKEGKAKLTFTPEREGYYRVAWLSREEDGAPIEAETAAYVATNASTELGERHGGLEIVVDKDTARAGQPLPVILLAPTNDRYVLFSVEGENLYSYQLIHMTGAAKLVEVPITEKDVPNIYLDAAMVSDREFFTDSKQVVIPPLKQFLNVELTPDHPLYQPREEGTFTVTAHDSDGKPAAAEISLGVVDESVFYIQQDYAGDPREFYFGTKRQHTVYTTGTMQQKGYAKLVRGEGEELLDEREWNARNMLGETGTPSPTAMPTGALHGYRRGMAMNGLAMDKAGVAFGRATLRDADRMDEQDAVGIFSPGTVGSTAVVSAAMPAAPGAAGGGRRELQMAAGNAEALKKGMAGAGTEPAVQVRSDFRSTIFWAPDIVTGADGKAAVKVKFPDSLTGWQATARVATAGNQFGIATANVRTRQPLIVRLEAPRFFVAGDRPVISAVINNNTDAPLTVTPSLKAEGVTISGLFKEGKAEPGEAGALTVPANGETRADWVVAVDKPGTAKLTVTARGGEYADAMENSYPIYEHGIEKLLAKSGVLRGKSVSVKLELPAARKAESTTLVVQVAPSMAVTMLDALPYLLDYPYGCTEQTMSRFLPAAITAQTLKELKIAPEQLAGKLFGGIEADFADKTHPQGKHDLKELNAIVKQSTDRLYDFQHADGGWGWWKEGNSDHYMTAYVLWGLSLAANAGLETHTDALARAAAYLDVALVEEKSNYDEQAWMLHALSAYHSAIKRNFLPEFEAKAFDNLWTNRAKLNAYTRALLAMSAARFHYTEQAEILARNLEDGVTIDTAPDTSIVMEGAQHTQQGTQSTAHWGNDGVFWHWSDGGVEATAFAVRALLAIDPKNHLIAPAVNWLIANRRGAQWNNTRDTAITVLALDDYLRQSGELSVEGSYEVLVNGAQVANVKLTPATVLAAPSRFTVPQKLLHDGANEIRLRRTSGSGPLYFATEARFFSLEEPITPAGNQIFVRRQYFKLVERPTLLKGYVYDRLPLGDNETVTSGERVEVVLSIEAKNDYDYLLFEDLKPAGLEAVQLRSGETCVAKELKSGAAERKFVAGKQDRDPSDYTGRERWVYQELRDRKVALFIDHLPQGFWELRYTLRAEVPGHFHALPVMGQAMYVPEIKCNGSEVRLEVKDK